VKIKKDWSRFILVKKWNIKGSVTRIVEQIVMDFGLLILHKTKVLVTIELFSRQLSFSLKWEKRYHKSWNGWFLSMVALSLFIFGLLILHSKKVYRSKTPCV